MKWFVDQTYSTLFCDFLLSRFDDPELALVRRLRISCPPTSNPRLRSYMDPLHSLQGLIHHDVHNQDSDISYCIINWNWRFSNTVRETSCLFVFTEVSSAPKVSTSLLWKVMSISFVMRSVCRGSVSRTNAFSSKSILHYRYSSSVNTCERILVRAFAFWSNKSWITVFNPFVTSCHDRVFSIFYYDTASWYQFSSLHGNPLLQ